MEKTEIQNLSLVSQDAQGKIVKAAETDEKASIFVPMGLMMLMLMVIMVGASPLLQSVLEEKTQRIAEVLLGSIPPFQLMLGKLLGMVGVSLTLATVYLVAAYFGIRRAGLGALFPAHIIWWFVLYQVLAVVMYGALFAAIGAAVTELKEAQSLMTPVMLVAMAPLFVWLNVVREPTSNFATFVSLVPPATPMLMILRQSVPPGVPLWQPVLGIVLVLLCTLFFVFAGARIFRVGILMQGKAPKPSELAKWIVRG
jgi:ABC-2 type transport system permease protein